MLRAQRNFILNLVIEFPLYFALNLDTDLKILLGKKGKKRLAHFFLALYSTDRKLFYMLVSVMITEFYARPC